MPNNIFKRVERSISSINPLEILADYSESEIKKEYQRLRKTALKRIERIERSDFNLPQYVEYHKHEWKPSSELDINDLATALSSVNRFIDMKGSLITEQRRMRRERREILEDEIIGRKFKNYDEMQLFDDFLDYLSNKYGDQFYYDIEDVIDLFDNYSDFVLDGSMSLDEFAEIYEDSYASTGYELRKIGDN